MSRTTETQKGTVTINFVAIPEIAYLGIRRAAVFLGLGINAAESPDLKDYTLDHHSPWRFLPPDVDGATLGKWKKEFGSWVVTCGLRELMETFGVFLDRVHEACLMMAVSKGKIEKTEAEDYGRSFPHKGIKDKLPAMSNRFDVAPDQPEALVTINQARNCLTHRRGIVGQKDCNDGATFSIRWREMQLSFQEPKGKEVVVELPLTKPVEASKGTSFKVRFVEKVRSIQKGTLIQFSPKELHDILVFLRLSTDQVIASAEQYASKLGIPLEPAKPESTTTKRGSPSQDGQTS